MTDTNSTPDEVTMSMSLGRIEVTACPDHPTTEPTLHDMRTARCSLCHVLLPVTWIGTVQP